MALPLVTLKIKKIAENLQTKNTRITIAWMFDNLLSNDCCYHIEDESAVWDWGIHNEKMHWKSTQ